MELLEDPPSAGHYFVHAWREGTDVQGVPADEHDWPKEYQDRLADQAKEWRDVIWGGMNDADVFWTSGDMVKLINTAAADLTFQMADEDFRPAPLMPTMMLSDRGFAFLDRQVEVEGLDESWSERYGGQDLTFKGFSWLQGTSDAGHRGLSITLYMDLTADPDCYVLREALRKQGAKVPDLLPFTTFFWTWGKGVHELENNIEPNVARWLMAFWTIVHEEIATKVQATMPRHERKRLMRENKPIPTVTVITLRRPKQPVDENQPVHPRHFRYRHLRRGHWRNQAHGKRHSERKLIYIRPTVVGDENLPFVATSRIFKVAR
jgi:hypothetical protein